MPETSPSSAGDRRVFLKTFCAGSLLCLGCERLQAATDGEPPPLDAFLADSGMSFKDVWAFAYTRGSIPLLKALGEKLGRDRLVEMLKEASAKMATEEARKEAPAAPNNTLQAFLGEDFLKGESRFWSHVLSYTLPERTETAVEARVTRCLWAQTFRAAEAPDIGYATLCHTDFFSGPAFNPKIRMTRTKTLMQGDDHCNHRWVVEA